MELKESLAEQLITELSSGAPEWEDKALCIGADPADVDTMMGLCAQCPVADQCRVNILGLLSDRKHLPRYVVAGELI